jgi:hypothetical protein
MILHTGTEHGKGYKKNPGFGYKFKNFSSILEKMEQKLKKWLGSFEKFHEEIFSIKKYFFSQFKFGHGDVQQTRPGLGRLFRYADRRQ